MLNKTLRSLSACVVLIVLTSACTKNGTVGKAQKPERAKIVIDEAYHSKSDSSFVATIWMDFFDAPDYHFKKASEGFAKEGVDNVAYEIRRAASFIQLEQIASIGDSKRDLVRTHEQMEKLAYDVQSGTLTARNLNKAFAQAQYSLARHYQRKAAMFWANKNVESTAYALKAAALNLKSAVARNGQKLETDDYAAINFARETADRLMKGAVLSANQVNRGIANMDREISKFSKKSTIVKK